MILNIPFEIGQKVWIWENRQTYRIKETCVGHDHMGPIGGYETIWTDHWGAYPYEFSFSLLDQFDVNEIFTSKEACERRHLSAF